MKVRVIAAIGIACIAGGSSPAFAAHRPKKPAVKPVCNIISDPGDDAPNDPTGGLAKQAPQDPNADILSADIASDATNLTVVVRLKSLASPDTSWPEAHSYAVQWNVPGHSTPVYLSGTIDPNPAAAAAYGPQFVFGDVATFQGVFTGFNVDSAAHVKGTVDIPNATVTMSVPISDLSGYGTFSPGTKFDTITATSQTALNGPDTPSNLPLFGGSLGFGVASPDTDVATKPYIAGTPSCVKPGS